MFVKFFEEDFKLTGDRVFDNDGNVAAKVFRNLAPTRLRFFAREQALEIYLQSAPGNCSTFTCRSNATNAEAIALSSNTRISVIQPIDLFYTVMPRYKDMHGGLYFNLIT